MRREYDPAFIRLRRGVVVGFLVFAVAWAGIIYLGWRETEARRADRTEQIDQLCAAVPRTAAAGAQALIDIIVADAERRGMPAARIANTRRLGVLYVRRARELALRDLPSCPKEP